MFFKRPDLTSGSRPELLPDESLLFVQDGVGLYEGKYKISTCQKGAAYLTSHRACYVDDVDPRRNSLAVDLRDVERHEFQAQFLRSSPKVTLYPKPLKRGYGSVRESADFSPSRAIQRTYTTSSSPATRTSSPFRAPPVQASVRQPSGTWICPICSLSNPVPSNFDPRNSSMDLPPCLACGVKPSFGHVLKAAINAASKQPSDLRATEGASIPPNLNGLVSSQQPSQLITESDGKVACPRCTFHNHPSLRNCEICGAPLPGTSSASASAAVSLQRPESPGPQLSSLNLDDDTSLESVKFSFRAGGEKVFYERLKGAMVQRKWLLQGAPAIPREPIIPVSQSDNMIPGSFWEVEPRPQSTPVGIAGLEQRGLQARRNNETVIGTAFEDLEALMASAKEIVALAEKFAADSGSESTATGSLLSESATAMGMVATKDMLGEGSSSLYISELSRSLAEYVSDDRRGVLRAQGGIMSLVDLWAVFNRSRNGVELVSPSDFHKAAELWEKLGLPVRLRRFRSGLLVVQRYDWSDEKTLGQFRVWLHSLMENAPPTTVLWDWETFGLGVTAQDAAERFGWSLGVATEELEMAEDRGLVCREEGVEGLRFWLNGLLLAAEGDKGDDGIESI